MTESKKSFLMYCDQIGLFEQLPDEKAGKLIKIIFAYVNDQNPLVEELLLKIAFEPIKLSLKRDLEKWNHIKLCRSESGKLGGRPKQTKAKKANALFEKQTKAKKAVSVSVSVSDSVNDNDNVKEKENLKNDKKEDLKLTPLPSKTIPTLQEFFIHAEASCKRAGVQFHELKFHIESKYNSWVEQGWKDGHNSEIKNWKSKFNNTLPHLKAIKNLTPNEAKLQW